MAANMTTVRKTLCAKFNGAPAPAAEKAACEANVTKVGPDCVASSTTNKALEKCIKGKLPGMSLWTAPVDPPPTPGDLINKVRAGGSLNSAEQTVVNAHIETLLTSEAVPNKDRSDADKANIAALGQLRADAATNPALKNILDDAEKAFKAKQKPAEPEFGKRSGFFAEGGCGLAITTATYGDSVTNADPVATNNPINTGAYGVGRSPSGNFPGYRCDGSVGYAKPVNDGLNVRFGVSYRDSVVRQGFESPLYGRSVPNLYQTSWMAFLGIEKQLTPRASVFVDAMLGWTDNKFADNTGYLQTSAQGTQYGALSALEGRVLSGGGRVGGAYRLFEYLSVYGALSVYGDATKAAAKTDGGGAFEYGTTGPEVTGTVGVRVGQ